MELKVKDFESALKSLEDIVVQLEAGDLTLDRALELFEEGIQSAVSAAQNWMRPNGRWRSSPRQPTVR